MRREGRGPGQRKINNLKHIKYICVHHRHNMDTLQCKLETVSHKNENFGIRLHDFSEAFEGS